MLYRVNFPQWFLQCHKVKYGDPLMVRECLLLSVFSHFSGDWPGSGCDIIGISNGPVDAADCMTIGLVMGWLTVKFKWPPVGRQWGWWANGAADMARSSNNQLANRASSSNYQLADSGIDGLMGWPTGQVQVITSWLTVVVGKWGVAVQLTNILAGCNCSWEKHRKSGCASDHILAGCNYSLGRVAVSLIISAGCNSHLGRVAV